MADAGDDLQTQVDEHPSHGVEDRRIPDGTEIEGYIVDGVLGKGGMGVVYSATHAVIGKRCAVKVLRMEVSSNPDTVNRFIQEARAVNQIGHPNIIDIFDFGKLPDGRLYHLMDLLVGESLRRRLRRGPLHPSEAASVIEGVTSALIAAHDKGFVHRDLKPDNIYLCTAERSAGFLDPGSVKLLDFGLAKLMPEAGVAAFTTKIGVMLGTPEYMAPEQARGQRVDYRVDVYALGVVMFEILAGQRPFPSGHDAFATLQYHADEPAPALAAFCPELPAEMLQLVDAMLAKEPAARPSLAAVRTVIKRLRTTTLPTKSVAGRALASFANPVVPVPPLAPSHIGTEVRLPAEPPRPSQRNVAQPIAAAGIPLDSFRIEPLPPPPAPPRRDTPPTVPDSLALGRGARAPVHQSTQLGMSPPVLAAPASSPAIEVPPPVLRDSSPSIQVAQVPPPAGSRRTWLILASVLVVSAGIALALVIALG